MSAHARDGERTHERILRLIVENGPISAMELAQITVLTAAAVRRHTSSLEAEGLITTYNSGSHGKARRGRPSRRYVATSSGQADFGESSGTIANSALDFISSAMGQQGMKAYAQARKQALVERYAPVVQGAGEDPRRRVQALARALTQDGYAASVRSVDGTPMLQLCQGHCPIREVAENHGLLCEAETEAFHELLGVHVQRIATQAGRAHACTLTVPAVRAVRDPNLPAHTRTTHLNLDGKEDNETNAA